MTKRGMTLIELIISSMLVGIVILGIVGVESAIRRSRNQATMQLKNMTALTTAMLHLKRDAENVVGSTVNDVWDFSSTGVVMEFFLGSDTKDDDIYISNYLSYLSIAFREPGDDIDDRADDYYVVYYFHYLNSNPPYLLLRDTCPLTDSCWSSGGEMAMQEGTGEVVAEFTKVDVDGDGVVDRNFFDYKLDSDGNLEYLEFHLATLADNTKNFDPILNPSYELITRVSPAGLTR